MKLNTFIKAQVIDSRIKRAVTIIDSLSNNLQVQEIREAALFLDIDDPIPGLIEKLQSRIHVKLLSLKSEFDALNDG